MGDRTMEVYLAVAATDGPVTAIEIASQLDGMDNNAAGQYLRRLDANGHIHKISRGVFSLRPPAETTDEVEAPHSFSSDTSFTPSESESAQNRVNEVMPDVIEEARPFLRVGLRIFGAGWRALMRHPSVSHHMPWCCPFRRRLGSLHGVVLAAFFAIVRGPSMPVAAAPWWVTRLAKYQTAREGPGV